MEFRSANYDLSENDGTVAIEVILSAPPAQNVRVDYYAESDTATAGSDYTLTEGTLTFGPSDTSMFFQLKILDDSTDEPNERFWLRLRNPQPSDTTGLGTLSAALVTIRDNDDPANKSPNAVDDTATTIEGVAVVVDVLANDSDADGTLDLSSVLVTSSPINGSTSVDGVTGAITYVPMIGFIGTDAFTYQVCDDDGACDSATVRVEVSGTPAVIVAPLSVNVTEGGVTGQYQVKLNSKPSANVRIAFAGTNPELNPIPNVTFTPDTWNTWKTITVVSVDDKEAEASHNATITHSASSSDTSYNGIAIDSVVVNIADNDSAGVSISKSSVSVTEGRTRTDTYRVSLTSQPVANVVINITVQNGQATVSPVKLTFTPDNWNVQQTVSVLAVDDRIDEPDTHTDTIHHSVSSSDTNYNGMTVGNVSVNIRDNDQAGIIVQPLNLTVREPDGTATFAIRLNSQPTASVSTGLSSSDLTACTVSHASVTFNNTNWNVDQIITVQAVDDYLGDGDQTCTIVTAPATSADTYYSGRDASDVTVTVLDNESDLEVSKSDGGITATPGNLITYTLTYTNNGFMDTAGTHITETVPDNTTFYTDSSTIGWSCADGSVAGTTCDFLLPSGGSLPVGSSGSILFAVQVNDTVPAGVEWMSNTTVITDDASNGIDPVVSNNTSTISTSLEAEPDLRISKTDDTPPSAARTKPITYTIWYTNTGTQEATGVVITETVPDYTTFDGTASSAGWSCPDGSAAGTTCTLNVGNLLAGDGGTATFVVNVLDVGAVPSGEQTTINSVTIADDGTNGADPTPGDNAATVTTTIDEEPWVVSIVRDDPSPTNATSVAYIVTLSEPVVGLSTSNFGITTTGTFAGTGVVHSVSDNGGGISWTIIITDVAGDGDLYLNMDNSTGVQDVDSVGNPVGNLVFTDEKYVIDQTEPNTTITVQPPDPDNNPDPSFSFTGTDNLSGVAGFECQLDGGSFTTCTSPHSYTGLADGTHTFAARARDNAGNVESSPASYTWVIDTVPPDTTITAHPPDPDNDPDPSFSFIGTDSLSGVAGFECQLDGGGFAACTSPHSYTGLTDGTHTFEVQAIDGAGNVDPSPASYPWVVDTVPPALTISEIPTLDTTPEVTGTVRDAASLITVTMMVDSNVYTVTVAVTPNVTTTWTLPDNTINPPLMCGTHPVTATATDPAGNTTTVTGTITILPTMQFDPMSYTVTEGDTLTQTVVVTVTLSGTSNQTVTVGYATSDGTAIAGADYLTSSGTLMFTAGVTETTFPVTITDDLLDEFDETLLLTLSNATNAVIGGTNPITLTIIDDDLPPVVQFSSAAYSVNEGDGTATITVTLSAPSGKPVTVDYATSDSTATDGLDYTGNSGTLTFGVGLTQTVQTWQTFAVSITDDLQDEPDETILLTLSDPENADLGATKVATLTITYNDWYFQTNGPLLPLTKGDWYTSNEGNNGYHYIAINVPPDWPTTTPITIELFSPAMHTGSGGGKDEIDGTSGSTEFELYAPGTPFIGPDQPGPGASGSLYTQSYAPTSDPESWIPFYTIPSPVPSGRYLLRTEASDYDGNGWGIRVNGMPTVSIGFLQATIQQSNLSYQNQCRTYYQYVAPGLASVTFQTFDMDYDSTKRPAEDTVRRLRYYGPNDSYDTMAITGTYRLPSGDGVWETGTITRTSTISNTIASPSPDPGWWRLVACVNNGNQYILEGQTGVPTYLSQPPTPAMRVSIDDGETIVSTGDTLTYTIALTNTASAPTPGAAYNITMTVDLLANVTYQDCGGNGALSGAVCTHVGGVVEITLNHTMVAGETGSVWVEAHVDAAGPKARAILHYKDSLGNSFEPELATVP